MNVERLYQHTFAKFCLCMNDNQKATLN